MTDLIDNVSRLGIFDIGDKWIDIGHIKDFKMANSKIKNGKKNRLLYSV